MKSDKNQEAVEALMLKLAQSGHVVSNGVIILYPEATEFADIDCIRKDGDRTSVVCANCNLVAEVRHIASFDFLTLTACPKCDVADWQKVEK